MALTIGTQLGSHEITALIGKGGMGEVYRARDLKLKREVAIKILPEEFARDPERISRFQREAELLASLNHPNIAAIYDVEEASNSRFLVLELVEGDTLADRLRRGPLPMDEALHIAKSICEALEAAHEKGVIHRDLKPGNVKVTPDGKVKVLDFGLAKALEGSPANTTMSNSPTLTMAGTNAGVILGTAAYMSPERAKGRSVDRRTDIFAFGCVLYEMLTGKRAFEGDDISDTLASVLRAEPDWNALPQGLPPTARTLIQGCLTKDRGRRIPDASVAKFALSQPVFVDTAPIPSSSRLKTAVFVTALFLSAVVAAAVGWALWPATVKPRVASLSVTLPEGQTFSSGRNLNIAISPDGTEIVYAANARLYRRSIFDFEPIPIPGSDPRGQAIIPAFSPDGRSIVFYAASENRIKRIPLDGGTPITICECGASAFTWTGEGILFTNRSEHGIFRVSPDGGMPQRIVTVKNDEVAHLPQMLPDDQTLLFSLTETESDDQWDKAKIVLQSLKTGERKTLIDGGSNARYIRTGHLIYAVAGTIYAVPFDLRTQTLKGHGVPVVQGVRRGPNPAGNWAQFNISDSGTLIYIPGSALPGTRTLMLMDRNGRTNPVGLPSALYRGPRVSRDGKHLVVGVEDGQEAYVSVVDFPPTGALRRLTFEGHSRFPVWSGNGQFVAFQSDRDGDSAIFMQRADGSAPAERLTKPEAGVSHLPESWSPDGKTLLFSAKKGATYSLWSLSIADKKMASFASVQSTDSIDATFSPDGRWVAYTWFDRPGNLPSPNKGVYVQPFPPNGARYQVPKEINDFHPSWGLSTAELFFTSTSNRLDVVSLQTHPTLKFGQPMTLPRSPSPDRVSSDRRDYDLMPDGRFISTFPTSDDTISGTDASQQIRVVLDWFSELQQRVPVK
jgi:serine/threonine-protein kinase